jgi:hypothetical protein
MTRSRDLANLGDNSSALENQGLTLISTTSFSTVSSHSVNDVFSSTYDDYKICLSTNAPATSQLFTMRLRVSGADNSGTDYYRMNNGIGAGGGTTALVGNTQTSWTLGHAASGGIGLNASFDILKPFSTSFMTGLLGFSIGENSAYNNATGYRLTNHFYATTSFTGFTLLFGANVTGSVSVYGYKK